MLQKQESILHFSTRFISSVGSNLASKALQAVNGLRSYRLLAFFVKTPFTNKKTAKEPLKNAKTNWVIDIREAPLLINALKIRSAHNATIKDLPRLFIALLLNQAVWTEN